MEQNKEKIEDVNVKKRCFIIMPFTTPKGYEEGHFTKVYEQIIKPAVISAGYSPERVDEDLMSTDIVAKIYEGISESEMAVCDLSSNNPNVLYELGIRQALNKPVVLIKDDITDRIFDIAGLGTVEYKHTRLYENVIDAIDIICKAIETNVEQGPTVLELLKRAGREINNTQIESKEVNDSVIILNEIRSLKRALSQNNYMMNSAVNRSKEEDIKNDDDFYLRMFKYSRKLEYRVKRYYQNSKKGVASLEDENSIRSALYGAIGEIETEIENTSNSLLRKKYGSIIGDLSQQILILDSINQ